MKNRGVKLSILAGIFIVLLGGYLLISHLTEEKKCWPGHRID